MSEKKWKPGNKVSFNFYNGTVRHVGRLVRREGDGGIWKIDTDDRIMPTVFAHERTFKEEK